MSEAEAVAEVRGRLRTERRDAELLGHGLLRQLVVEAAVILRLQLRHHLLLVGHGLCSGDADKGIVVDRSSTVETDGIDHVGLKTGPATPPTGRYRVPG